MRGNTPVPLSALRLGWLATLWCSALLCAEPAGNWHPHLAPALAEIGGTDRHPLVLFTGLTWDDASKSLDERVLRHADFADALGGDFVLTHVDLPRTPRQDADLSEMESGQYALARDFRVRRLPVIYLCTGDGHPYALLEPENGDPGETAAALLSMRRNFLQAGERTRGLAGPDLARALETLLQQIPEALRGRHTDTMRAIVEADPQDSTGLRAKYLLELELPGARQLRYLGRLDEAEARYRSLIETLKPTGERLQDLLYELADVHFQRKDFGSLLTELDRALDAAPGSGRVPVIEEMFEVFTRQWVFTRFRPEQMEQVEYDWKRIEPAPGEIQELLELISEMEREAPASRRNVVLASLRRTYGETKGAAD